MFGSLDLSETCAACAAFAAERLGAVDAHIYLLEGASVRRAASARAASDGGAGDQSVPRPLARRVRDIAAGREPAVEESDGTLLVPVVGGEEVVAVLAVDGPVRSRDRDADLGAVTSLISPALGNALAFREACRRAEHLADLVETKSQFLNLAAHEVRGPLTVLMGYFSLLEDGSFGEVPLEMKAALPAINARILEMDQLITAMLETARLDDHRLELIFAEGDLGDLAAEAISRAEGSRSVGQALVLTGADSRVPVNVDRTRILLVIGHLIDNALKYSVEGTDVICRVRVEGGEAALDVVDTGVGIAEADLPVLFTRFGRVRRNPALHSVSGLGLGLFLAQQLARAHGGLITVASHEGQGSTFTLRLPVAR